MAEILIGNKSDLTPVADAIKEKTGSTEEMTLAQMAEAVRGIEPGGDIDGLIDGSITEVTSNVKNIRNSFFKNYTNLTSVNLPLVTSIGEYAFYECSNLTSVNLPLVTSISHYAFEGCIKLTTVDFPSVTSISHYAFQYCTRLTTVDFPAVTSIGDAAFQYCHELTTVDFPSVTSIGQYAFQYCHELTTVDFPLATNIGKNAFYECTSLTTVDFPAVTSIGQRAFYDCRSLTTIILRSEIMCSLGNVDAFNYCYHLHGTVDATYNPDGLKDGYIYVPKALIEEYKMNTNWRTFTDVIRPIETTLSATSEKMLINSTSTVTYKLYHGIDVPLTEEPVITVESSDPTAVTISNIAYDGQNIIFDVATTDITGTVDITVTATLYDETFTDVGSISVWESFPEITYSVEEVDGASYGFALNDAGYYESTNKGISSSAAVCKVTFNTHGFYNLYIDCINYAESNYDYGILSNVDATLGTSSSADSSNVFRTFKGAQSASVQTVNYGVVESGEHFIYIKFIKDSSDDNNNDSLQFKVRMEP